MNYSIENNFLKATISSKGAELISLVLKSDMCEYIWQGDEKYCTGHSPIMFPICGRLCQGKYRYLKNTYELGGHGFARHSEFDLSAAKNDEITLTLKSSDATRAVYPFDFIFNVTFSLSGSSIVIKYKVVNTDNKDIIFSVGGHPAFNVPLGGEGSFEDYYVEFDSSCDAVRLSFTPNCLCDERDPIFTQGGTKRINLKHDLFDDDAIFLYNTSKKASLKSDVSKKSVSLYFDNFKYISFIPIVIILSIF